MWNSDQVSIVTNDKLCFYLISSWVCSLIWRHLLSLNIVWFLSLQLSNGYDWLTFLMTSNMDSVFWSKCPQLNDLTYGRTDGRMELWLPIPRWRNHRPVKIAAHHKSQTTEVEPHCLPWLPIDKRIDYKLCLLVHKASIGQTPTYIADVLTPVSSVQSLSTQRLATNGDYIVPRTHRKLGERAFSVASPKAWNQLPTNLKTSTCSTGSFKRSLKTFLFESAYGCETRVSWLL